MNRIFNFHEVADIKWFEAVVIFLKSRYKLIGLAQMEDYYSGASSLTNACHITIDDGHLSFYNVIHPVLKKHKVPASLYVSPKICKERSNFWFQQIGKYDEKVLKGVIASTCNIPVQSIHKYGIASIFKTISHAQVFQVIRNYQKAGSIHPSPFVNMTVSQLREVDNYGLVSIGAHTLNHPILANEDDENAEREIAGSINGLADLLNHEIRYFSFPNGIPDLDFGEREKRCVRENGIKLAFSTEAKNFCSKNDTASVPRIGISCSESLFSIQAKLLFGSGWDTLRKIKPNGEHAERKTLKNIFRESMLRA
jgi:peptidoglycan/xylan/chitin deacetylase (PgdA/CDA1 family)